MLAAEISREESSEPSSYDHKVRSNSAALEALSLDPPEYPATNAASPSDTISTVTLSPPTTQAAGVPPPSAPLDISSASRNSSSSQLFRPGSSGRIGSLLGCFSSGGLKTLENEESYSSTVECEVGIRPSFYWMDAPVNDEQRAEAEVASRFFKADCQDEAKVIQNFAGISGLTFIGVFDGHGPHGRSAAKFASERLLEALAAETTALQSRSERKRLKAMREACKKVNTLMQNSREAGFDASLSGTTACFALVAPSGRGTRILLANVGDSRCVLARRRADGGVDAIPLTVDAKPSLPQEARRVISCGGVVQQLLDENGNRSGPHRVFRRGDDVLPGLAMSRSLGDSYAHSVGVTWEPMLSTHNLGGRDLFLVLGTDGLWDVMENDAAVDFVERYRCQRDPRVSCAEALTLEAQERWKAAHDEALVDDISCAILHFAAMPPPDPSQSSLPRTLSRAASCNDEANKLASAWLTEREENPSTRSPRPLFQYLYRSSKSVGSGDFWDSLPRDAPGSPSRVAAEQRDEEEKEKDRSRGVPPPISSSGVPTPRPSPAITIQKRGGDLLQASPLSTPPEDVILQNPAEHAVHGGHSLRSSLHRTSYLATHEEHVEYREEIVSASYGVQSQLQSRNSGGGGGFAIPSKPIPMDSMRRSNMAAAASAPAAPGVLSTSAGGGGFGGNPLLRPIRKAYPSVATMTSVPSWDGGFSSYLSETSLHLQMGTETPRSSESDHSVRPSKLEGRHEGKVRRGIPCSLSSTGLNSMGRASTDSERTISQSNSRVGSHEESGLLSSAMLAGSGPTSPIRTTSLRYPLSPGRSYRGIPRAVSHGSLASASYKSGAGGSTGRSTNVIRPLQDSLLTSGAL